MSTRVLATGLAQAEALVLEEPLSFWGGVDPETGAVIDRRHPQAGARISGRVIAMPYGRGSSSSSTVLAECIRLGTAPAAILLLEPDPILALGAAVAHELYERSVAIVVLTEEDYRRIRTGDTVTVDAGPSRSDPLVYSMRFPGAES